MVTFICCLISFFHLISSQAPQPRYTFWEYNPIDDLTDWTWDNAEEISSSNRIKIWGNDGNMYRTQSVDTNGYKNIHLEFELGLSNGAPLSDGDYARVQYQIDGLTDNWITLKQYDQNDLPVTKDITLPTETAGNSGLRIRFKNTGGSGSGDSFYIEGRLRLTGTIITDPPTTPYPTKKPTEKPTTKTPTEKPTEKPTTKTPTGSPTPSPTNNPTPSPTDNPTPAPTDNPSPAPTNNPSPAPTDNPTPAPTSYPTPAPTINPTPSPTNNPTFHNQPTSATQVPTNAPTQTPTDIPTPSPTYKPSDSPTNIPTNIPTKNPSESMTSTIYTKETDESESDNFFSSLMDDIKLFVVLVIICILCCCLIILVIWYRNIKKNKQQQNEVIIKKEVEMASNIYTIPQSPVSTAGGIESSEPGGFSLEQWLSDIELMQYYNIFAMNGFGDVSTNNRIALLSLNNADLKEMGILKVAHRKLLLKEIQKENERTDEVNGNGDGGYNNNKYKHQQYEEQDIPLPPKIKNTLDLDDEDQDEGNIHNHTNGGSYSSDKSFVFQQDGGIVSVGYTSTQTPYDEKMDNDLIVIKM